MPKKGEVKNSIKGMINYNNFGSKMIVTDDRGSHDIDVYFPEYDWTFENTRRDVFKNGQLKCPYEPRVNNIGYLGEGKYKVRDNGKQTKCYNAWKHMLDRCYDKNTHIKRPTYKDCVVCNEWLCFQNFAEWYYNNYYEINNETMYLDKDILVKGNKVYSPETCVFVNNRINILFIKGNRARGKFPIGVHYHKRIGKYQSQCDTYEKGKMFLGYYSTPEEAFQSYKTFKEKYIKQVADEYKNLIPQRLYEAMYNYEVEITD